MTDRIHVTMNIDLFVEDEKAMRDAAFERMREAWSSEDDFPYDSAGDVPLGQVIHSLLADALPPELPGCRRSQLEVESDTDDTDDSENGAAGSRARDTSEGDTNDGGKDDEEDESDDRESGTEDESGTKDESADNESGDDGASSRSDDKTA